MRRTLATAILHAFKAPKLCPCASEASLCSCNLSHPMCLSACLVVQRASITCMCFNNVHARLIYGRAVATSCRAASRRWTRTASCACSTSTTRPTARAACLTLQRTCWWLLARSVERMLRVGGMYVGSCMGCLYSLRASDAGRSVSSPCCLCMPCPNNQLPRCTAGVSTPQRRACPRARRHVGAVLFYSVSSWECLISQIP